MKKSIVFAGVAFVAALSLTTTPAIASTGNYGDLSTINPLGGSTPTDGLKIDIASSQMQVSRDGIAQLYPIDDIPVPTDGSIMSNYFQVSFDDEETFVIGQGDDDPDYAWESGTSEETLTDSDRSGTVVNTLVSENIPGRGTVTLEITFAYTYPDLFINVSTELTLPGNWAFDTRLHWNADAALGGFDAGNQFEGVSKSGQQVRGVVSLDGGSIEAFRQVEGEQLNSWAGHYLCPWNSESEDLDTGACNPSASSDWVTNNQDAPNTVSISENIDNGFGVSTVATGPVSSASFDLLFVGCAPGVAPVLCLDAALAEVDAPAPTPEPEPTLAATGPDALAPLGVAGALLIAGGLVAWLARHQRVSASL